MHFEVQRFLVFYQHEHQEGIFVVLISCSVPFSILLACVMLISIIQPG